MSDWITYLFPNFNCATFEVWEWINNSFHTLLSVWLLLHDQNCSCSTIHEFAWNFVLCFVVITLPGPIGSCHDDVIKWKHFPRYWPFVRGIHRLPVNSPNTGKWHGALMFSVICAWINSWVNNREAGDLRRHRAHYDVIVMIRIKPMPNNIRIFCISHAMYTTQKATFV